MDTHTQNLVLSIEEQLTVSNLTGLENRRHLRRLEATTDDLRMTVESQGRRLEEILQLIRADSAPPKPKSNNRPPRPSTPKSHLGIKVWCFGCGAGCEPEDSSCAQCKTPLHTLGELAETELGFALPPQEGRFASKGWSLIGLTPAECPDCIENIHCAFKIFVAAGERKKYWALLCRGCSDAKPLENVRREQAEALDRWVYSQRIPVLGMEPEAPRVMKATLEETLTGLRQGHSPMRIAKERHLAEATVLKHLPPLVQMGRLGIEELFDSEVVERVVCAHAEEPRPVDVYDLETRLEPPVSRRDLETITACLGLEMGLGDPITSESRDEVRGALARVVGMLEGRLTAGVLLGICKGIESFRNGRYSVPSMFGLLRGVSREALVEEIRCMVREGEMKLAPGKKLALGTTSLEEVEADLAAERAVELERELARQELEYAHIDFEEMEREDAQRKRERRMEESLGLDWRDEDPIFRASFV